jgi:DNA-binding beta-propeller fold protein YncE
VGTYIGDVAVDQLTNTIYTANPGNNTVSVIEGRTCSAMITSGCGQTPQTVTTGTGSVASLAILPERGAMSMRMVMPLLANCR